MAPRVKKRRGPHVFDPRGGELLAFVRIVRPAGAWLGRRDGRSFRVTAAWRAAKLISTSIDTGHNRLLRKLLRTRAPVVCQRADPDWPVLPNPVHRADKYWLGVPLLDGGRVVGVVSIWGPRLPGPAAMRRLRLLAQQLSKQLISRAQLQDLAAELEQAVANIPETPDDDPKWSERPSVARHVLRRLGRALPDAVFTLWVPAGEQGAYHYFRAAGNRLTSGHSSSMGELAPVPRRNRPLRSPGAKGKGAKLTHAPLSIRLAHRQEGEGTLQVEARAVDVYRVCVELVRGRIAGPLAALLAHMRRRQVADIRARRLGLIGAISLELAGLTDTRQIVEATAGRISQLFEGGLTRIVLTDGGTTALMAATAGSVGMESIVEKPPDVAEIDKALSAESLNTGRSLLVRGRDARKELRVDTGEFSGLAMCVPLKDGGRILGTIEVRRGGPKSLGADDLDALECVAAVVAAVLVAARRTQSSAGEPSAAAKRPQRIPEDRLIRAARLISVGEMAAGIAHELNNPLTTVAGFTELILDEIPLDAAYRADVEMVLQEARRARGVVRRLLDFARQGEGVRSRADVGEIVDDVLGLTMHLMRTNGVRLEFVRAENLPWVLVNSNQLKQVFLNLIHNALQAMPAGGNLSVRIEPRVEAGRDWIVARIKDDGLGIRPGDMARLFEPFFTTRAEHGGTGLGLSVSYGIVSEHGGKIDVESQPGHGSTFSVWLPV